MTSFLITDTSSGETRDPSSSPTGEASISTPALMMTADISVPRIPSSEKPQISITPAETRVASVMTASKSASEPEAISASLFSRCRLTYQPSSSFTTMATMITMRVVVV